MNHIDPSCLAGSAPYGVFLAEILGVEVPAARGFRWEANGHSL